MKTLSTFFDKNGFTHRQRVREGDLAIFERWKEGQVAPPHFEVIRIQKHNGHEFPDGRVIEPGESYPVAEDWGVHGWTCPTLEKAMERLKMLKAGKEGL